MEDTSLDSPELDQEISDSSLAIVDRPGMITDPGEYRLDLLRYSNQNDSEEVVENVLTRTQTLIDQYSAIALEALEQLGEFPDNAVPGSGITLRLPASPDLGYLEVEKPGRPTYPTVNTGDKPELRGEIEDVVFTAPVRPDTSLPDAPTERLEWEESEYISVLFNALKNSATDIIINGGTGLSAEFEDAVWSRAVAREELQHETRYSEAERYYAAKKHKAPPGGLIARLNLLNRERARNLELMNSELVKNQLELGRQHSQFMHELGEKLERLSIEDRNASLNRALDAAKSMITLLYDNYKTVLETIRTKAEIYRTDMDGERVRVDAISSKNKSLTDTYIAEWDAYEKRLTTEFGIIESITRMYLADMAGYEAEVKAGGDKANALIERYKADTSSAQVQGQISLGEYENFIKALLGMIDLKLGSQKEVGRLSAQVAASALSAFNASASISDSSSRSRSYSEGKSLSMGASFSQSISNTLGIGISKSKSASDSYGESRSYSTSE